MRVCSRCGQKAGIFTKICGTCKKLIAEEKRRRIEMLEEEKKRQEQEIEEEEKRQKQEIDETKYNIIKSLLNGKIPTDIIEFDGHNFNLQKKEVLLWCFQSVKYYEDKLMVSYKGGSAGISFKLAKGVHIRTGKFKGQRIQNQETVYVGEGLLGITDEHLYFSSNTKSFRIPHKKIVSIQSFSDGVCIQKEAQSSKPQLFVVNDDDGEFLNTLIKSVQEL